MRIVVPVSSNQRVKLNVRLLIIEPDREVLESHLAFFHRTTEFEIQSAVEVEDGIQKFIVFVPHVMLIEPALLDCLDILDQAKIPVIVLSRISNDPEIRLHPAVTEYYVKPRPLTEIGKRIETLASSLF